jgi:hypothetical protein
MDVGKREDRLLDKIPELCRRREMTIVQLRLFKLKHPELSEYWDALETLIR